tara:strand:+ start:1765 stop:2763 length:999 start_codon:yes stop_codon:yes gene_type:complete
MKYILEITTKIGCSNMCEYCPQDVLVKTYKKNIHNKRLTNRYDANDSKWLDKLLVSEYTSGDRNRKTMMSLNDFKLALSTIPTEVDIHFAGYTEAFENPECIDMVEHSVSKGHSTGVNTTLVGVKKSDLDRLSKLNFKHFHVHLPSATYFETIGRTSAKVKMETGKEITDEYLDMIDYTLKYPKLSNFHTHSAPGKELHTEIEEWGGTRIRAAGYKNRGICSRAGNIGEMEATPLWEGNWCHRIIQNVLLPDGTVQLCCQDYGLEEPLGNLYQMPYHELFETELFKTKIMAGKSEICQRCDEGVAVPGEYKTKLGSMQNYEDEWRKAKNVNR